MPYRIVYAEEIRDHLRYLTARQRAMLFDSIEEQLTHEPTAEARFTELSVRANTGLGAEKATEH